MQTQAQQNSSKIMYVGGNEVLHLGHMLFGPHWEKDWNFSLSM